MLNFSFSKNIFIFVLIILTGAIGGILFPELFKRSDNVIYGESVALFGTSAKKLFYPIKSIRSVYGYNQSGGRVDYGEGDDYELINTKIARKDGSAIYNFDNYKVPLTKGKFAFSTAPRNPPYLFLHQVYVDYETDERAPSTIVGEAPASLTGHIVVAGDSITGAANTINREFFDSDSQGYVGLLRNHFRNQFGVVNFSFDGSTIGQLSSGLDDILAHEPSALVVAFGMNDHVAGSGSLASFEAALKDIVDAAQSKGTYVVLVGFFQPNSLWENSDADNTNDYNTAIAAIAEDKDCGYVDVKEVWDAAAKIKNGMYDLTGDYLHHPNNFGHRLYFSAILPSLLSTSIPASSVADYVRLPE